MVEKTNNSKGITLIALSVTIIVLLILAGVSIAILTGNNGIIEQTQNAKDQSEKASVIERAQKDVVELLEQNRNYPTKQQLKQVLDKYFKNVPNPIPNDLTTVKLTAKDEYGGYTDIKLTDIYDGIVQ